MNVVGIDRDHITLEQARQLQKQIQKEEQCNVILYQTVRGFHFKIILTRGINKEEHYAMRLKYGDCKERIRRSKLRDAPGVPTDILFALKIKNGNKNWRRRVW